jgi:poly(3-hydroxyalkanoate) depolymerase
VPLHYRHVDIDGHRIRVAERNSDAREAGSLLIFNGAGSPIEVLTPLLRALHNHHLVTFDVPGVGGSSAPLLPRRLRHYASMAAGVMDALRLERANIMGISWGGLLAQQFALQFQARTERLILAATSPGQLMVPPNPLVLLRLATPRRYFDRAHFEEIAGSLYGGDFRNGGKSLARAHAKRMTPPNRLGYLQQVSAVWGWTSAHKLRRLRAPTLIMAGSDDPIIPLINARIMAALIRRARLEIFDCGHLFLLTRLDRSVTVLEDFLAETLNPIAQNS